MTPSRGISLIEVMVGVVVLAIIATVSLPSFRQYSVRGNRTVAKTVLSQIAQQQEDWFSDHKSYATRLSLLGYPADALYIDSAGEMRSGTSSSSTYRISQAAVGSGDYTRCSTSAASSDALKLAWVLVAEPQNAQATSDYACSTLCLYSSGQRGAMAALGTEEMYRQCWAR
jgi:type IV pilus assembly protein PilE